MKKLDLNMKIANAIMKHIKEENKSINREDLNKSTRFEYMTKLSSDNETSFFDDVSGENISYDKYELTYTYNPGIKGLRMHVQYMVCIYSNGDMGLYFDGTF